MTMRIGLVMQGSDAWIGGSEYTRNLIDALSQLPPAERKRFELILVVAMSYPEESLAPLLPKVDGVLRLVTKRQPVSLSQRIAIRLGMARPDPNFHFKKQINASGIDLLYPITYDNIYNIRVALPLTPEGLSARWIGWIPDFQHKYLPNLFAADELARREEGISILTRDAKVIVFSSESAANDFRRFYPESPAAAKVLRFCTNPPSSWYEGSPAAVQRLYNLPSRYLLVSNQWWRHKNHLLVFDALNLLKEEGVRPFVVFTGSPSDFRDAGYASEILQRVHEFGIAGQVALLGLISRIDQIQLMRGAVAVVQPSLFEGWSTVVEDARALGRPMVLSDFAVHIEQNAPRVTIFDRSSARSLADALNKAWAELAPGPDEKGERVAREMAEAARHCFGETFLSIASSSL